MPDTIKLVAEPRSEFGKGAARRIRRADRIPAVMYGHGHAPVHITLPGHDTMLALKNANALLEIEIEGKPQLALARDVQRDAIKPFIEHVDLVVVRRGEKVTVDVSILTEGEAGPETVVQVENATLQLEVEATHIPESLTVSVEGLEAGSQIHAKDVDLPRGASLVTDEEALVINITAQVTAEELEAELAEAEAEAGIEKEDHDEEGAAESEEAAESGSDSDAAEEGDSDKG